MMKLDPSEEDSDDSGNNGGRESPTGEAGQVVDLEVCHSLLPRLRTVLAFALKSLVRHVRSWSRHLG